MAVLMLLEATAKAECVSELKSLLKERLPETRTFDGCQGLTAYLNVDDGRTVVIVERWDTKEAHQKYMAWRAEIGARAQLSRWWRGLQRFGTSKLLRLEDKGCAGQAPRLL